MCDFCRNKKKIIDGKGNLVLFGAENNMIFDNSDGKEVVGAVKINFCPICGRKLV
nr:MAG TPA: Rad50 zinc hook motif [Caudoviricetes sp.]